MLVIDEAVLDVFRAKRLCEFCKKTSASRLEPAHIFAKGFGGGNRVDVPENMVALCLNCHQSQHDG